MCSFLWGNHWAARNAPYCFQQLGQTAWYMLDAEGVYSDHQENALVGIWGLSSLHSSPKPTKHYLNHRFSSLHPFSLICSSSCLNSSDICTSLTKSQGCVRYGVGGDKYTIYNGLSGHRNKNQLLWNHVINSVTERLSLSHLLPPTSHILNALRHCYYIIYWIHTLKSLYFA